MSDSVNPFAINPERGTALFALQVQIFPELEDEVIRLGTNLGLINAIMYKMGEAISEDPMRAITVTSVRDILGVPIEPENLDEWRRGFWQAFKDEQEARHSQQ